MPPRKRPAERPADVDEPAAPIATRVRGAQSPAAVAAAASPRSTRARTTTQRVLERFEASPDFEDSKDERESSAVSSEEEDEDGGATRPRKAAGRGGRGRGRGDRGGRGRGRGRGGRGRGRGGRGSAAATSGGRAPASQPPAAARRGDTTEEDDDDVPDDDDEEEADDDVGPDEEAVDDGAADDDEPHDDDDANDKCAAPARHACALLTLLAVFSRILFARSDSASAPGVEKVLASRFACPPAAGDHAPPALEYLVKRVGIAHVHAEWLSASELASVAPYRLRGWVARHGSAPASEEDARNSVPLRFVAKQGTRVLVRWGGEGFGLGYDCATWEEVVGRGLVAAHPDTPRLLRELEDREAAAVRRASKPERAAEKAAAAGGAAPGVLDAQPPWLEVRGRGSPGAPALMPHQLEALAWLRGAYHSKCGVILADESACFYPFCILLSPPPISPRVLTHCALPTAVAPQWA